MNKELNLSSVVAIALITLGITVAAFFLATQNSREALDITALVFVLISETLVFGSFAYLAKSKSSKRIFSTGISSMLVIYWITTVALLLFRALFSEKLNTFIIIEIALIGIAAIICILLNLAAAKVVLINNKSAETLNSGQTKAKRGGF